ncbi:MAG: hypothetical protein Q4P24_09955 [Rhodobacterales bacterium]|nr:hypothetical protein [Rhodobacterales bacterium]
MTFFTQRKVAIAGAVIAAAIFIAANAHLITVAVTSQPDCTLSARGAAAKPSC